MSSAHSATQATGNLFLDNLPAKALQALTPYLSEVSLKRGAIVYDRDDIIDKVLFPIASVLSVVLEMSDGDTAEVAIIGREGMSGVAPVLGVPRSNQRTVVQVPSNARCIATEDFQAVIEREPELKAFALRYAQTTVAATAQISACNSLHPTNERCARWLLMAHDRVADDLILLTHF